MLSTVLILIKVSHIMVVMMMKMIILLMTWYCAYFNQAQHFGSFTCVTWIYISMSHSVYIHEYVLLRTYEKNKPLTIDAFILFNLNSYLKYSNKYSMKNLWFGGLYCFPGLVLILLSATWLFIFSHCLSLLLLEIW